MATLRDVIYDLIANGEKAQANLSRKLYLAYTPTDRGDMFDHRLVWSRKSINPSEVEDRVIESHFRAALDKHDLVVFKVVEREFQTSFKEGWGSSLLVLRTSNVRQGELFDEEE